MIDELVTSSEIKTEKCYNCGGDPSIQIFGPGGSFSGENKIWICSNYVNFKVGNRTCRLMVSFTSEENWNAYHSHHRTVSPAISFGMEDILSILKFHGETNKLLTSRGLWNKEMDALQLNYISALERISLSVE